MGNLQYRSTVWIGQHICADSACSKNQSEIWYRLYGTKKEIKVKKPQCQAGDKVRLNKKFCPFKKSYLPGWTEEVFLVKQIYT